MKIAVVGTGYVGLVSGVCFAEFGFDVTCIDKDANKIVAMKQGKPPIYEPGLEALMISNAKAQRLHFTTDLTHAVGEADVVIIAVGTPASDTGQADLTHVMGAAHEIAFALKKYALVIVKSTVPVGTNRKVAQHIAECNPSADFDVASNPEFLREGAALDDFMKPDRIVLGVDSKRAQQKLERLYEPIALNGAQMVITTLESAEMIKYASNALLATRIAFINEVADLCEKLGANVRDVARGMGLDTRIGPHFLKPGPGYGGSCFPKDTLALQHMAHAAEISCAITDATIQSNDTRKARMAAKMMAALDGSVRGKTIACLGLTFKPATDDMRESPALVILPELLQAGAAIRAYDPQGMHEAAKLLPEGISWCKDAYEAAAQADAVMMLTEWNEFRSLDLARLREMMRGNVVMDYRNIYKRKDMLEAGFHYHSIGRATVHPGELWIKDLNPSQDEAA